MYRAWLLQTIAGHILYSALACAKLLLELLQETAARIYLRLSVTPCSAAVRAQHSAAPNGVHGVLDPKREEAKKSKQQRDIHYLRRMDSTWMDFSSSAKL